MLHIFYSLCKAGYFHYMHAVCYTYPSLFCSLNVEVYAVLKPVGPYFISTPVVESLLIAPNK